MLIEDTVIGGGLTIEEITNTSTLLRSVAVSVIQH